MNQILTYSFFLFFFCLSANAFGQDKSIPKLKKDPLDYVRSSYDVDIKYAFTILDEEIKKATKKNNAIRLAETYVVLARVNEFLGDYKSANENLAEALTYLKITAKVKKLDLRNKIEAEYFLVQGKIFLSERKPKSADNAFGKCQKINSSLLVYDLCKEGKADVLAFQDEHQKAIDIYDSLKNSKTFVKKDIARIESKIANSLASIGKIQEANEAYQNAAVYDVTDSNESEAGGLNNDVNNRYIKEARKTIIESAKIKKLDPIDISIENINEMKEKDLPKLAIQREQIELSKLYLEDDRIAESEAILDEVINYPDENLSELNEAFEIKAKIGEEKKDYKQAYEFLKKKINKEGQSKSSVLKEKAKLDKNIQDYKIEGRDSLIQSIKSRSTFLLLGLLSLITLGSLIFSIFLWRNIRAKNKANKLLELKSLRTQMNPHFVFNSMNSINNFIALNDEKSANKYIADFSKLIRKIMDYSQREFISLEEEVELLDVYLRLEQMRFRDKFDYTFKVDHELKESSLQIPPMLIQPLIENAVWHGLRYKKEKGHLSVNISRKGDKKIEVQIEDDGIGRERSITIKTKNQKQYKSTGISNIEKRIELINDLYDKQFSMKTADKDPKQMDQGTVVSLNLNLK